MSGSSNFLPICDPDLKLIAANKSDPFTPRRAIDSTGRLGSFYDACCEQVLERSHLSLTTQVAQSKLRPSCSSEICDSQEARNLLEWYNVHHELRLSVALQMVREAGVGGLINYSGHIDNYTRIIDYNYYGYTEYISDEEFKSLTRKKISMPDTSATHVIVLVNWGVCALAVLQLPRDEDINKIDQALQNLCISLRDNRPTPVLSPNDKQWLQKIVHTEVLSSIPNLAKVTSIIDFHREIPRIKNNRDLFRPYNYSLCSIESFYKMHKGLNCTFKALRQQDASAMEHYLLELSSSMKRLRKAMEQNYSNLQQHLKNQLLELRKKFSNLEQMHKDEIQRLRNIVFNVRRRKTDCGTINKALNDSEKKEMLEGIEIFEGDLIMMQEKEQLIGDLLQHHFDYRDAREYGIENGDNEEKMERKLLTVGKCDRVIRFDNISRSSGKSKWDELVAELTKKRKDNPQQRFIYIDLSGCSHEPDYFVIVSKIIRSPSPRPKTDGTINILLLGESGVGKSTFINALANYLTFGKLEDAKKKPLVLIPVCFLMTVGDNFKEKQVKFSKDDDLHNEDYEHVGQSVTQHCKSYVFTLNDDENRGRKLRIIDSPGIGDVRGAAQDDINMQHILSFMTNLTHLNAVCILLKPNNARLNIFFRSCLTQLFDLLGENACDKIIFCFTNSRATFYTPGDTGPLLKKLLESLRLQGTPFAKQNTFCFDSESFRYLLAVRNEIKFTKNEEKDYKESWKKSSNEAKRFLEYIRTKTESPLVPGEFKSMKDAQLKVTMMIRPILEMIRNILQNTVVRNCGFGTKLIELRPRPIRDATGICSTCSRQYTQLDDLWITYDSLHYFHKNCRTCRCSPNDHYTIDYQLEYSLCDRRDDHSDEEMIKTVDALCQASAEFGYFLVGESENDPFLAGIERMIKEESDICQTKPSSQFNSNLLHHLEELKKNYEEKRRKLLDQKERMELSKIYARIEGVSKYEMIKSQMAAAREWFKFRMKHYEEEVLA